MNRSLLNNHNDVGIDVRGNLVRLCYKGKHRKKSQSIFLHTTNAITCDTMLASGFGGKLVKPGEFQRQTKASIFSKKQSESYL